MKPVIVSSQVSIGQGLPLCLIAGPCQIETLDHARKIASFLKEEASKRKLSFIYKSSYDKANRTSLSGTRGLGIDEGLKILDSIRKEFDVPVITDIHSPEEATIAGQVVDVLQTPAFLCRQTDLLIAAGKTGKTINVKKGQFLHPADMEFVAEKVASTGNQKILLCERGASFGYRDLIVDMRGLEIMKRFGYPVVFDGTHSVQSMGGEKGSSGGSREFIPALVRGAVAVGVDALFLECHENPEKAPSDGKSMLPLNELSKLLDSVVRIREATTI